MFQRAAGGSPAWAMGTLARMMEVDARIVRAGGPAIFRSHGVRATVEIAVDAEDLDKFARAWLAFREGK